MRARNIKPGFWENEDLVEMPMCARLCFIGLWCLADRDGKLEHRPKKIKLQLFPYDDVDIGQTLASLGSAGLILFYTIDNIEYIQIVNFNKHQSPHVREAESKLPNPEESTQKGTQKHNLGMAQATPRQPDSLNPDSLNPDKEQGVNSCKTKCANGTDFERFWASWPQKRNKLRAKQAFMRKKFTPEDVDELILDVENRKKRDKQWQQGFIPHCSTYLNGHRWEDNYGR